MTLECNSEVENSLTWWTVVMVCSAVSMSDDFTVEYSTLVGDTTSSLTCSSLPIGDQVGGNSILPRKERINWDQSMHDQNGLDQNRFYNISSSFLVCIGPSTTCRDNHAGMPTDIVNVGRFGHGRFGLGHFGLVSFSFTLPFFAQKDAANMSQWYKSNVFLCMEKH